MPRTMRLRLRQLLILPAAALLTAVSVAGTAPSASADAHILSPLTTWWNAARGDNFGAGTPAQNNSAVAAGYTSVRREGYLLATLENSGNGIAPLELFWNSARQDNFSTATRAGITSAYGAGYIYVGSEGYVYITQVPGSVPLYQFWSSARQDNFVTATQAGIDSAYGAGYTFVRIEGYVFPDQYIG